MDESDIRGCICCSLETESYQGGEMAAQLMKWDTQGGEIGDVEKTFLSAASDGHDAAEDEGVLKEWKKVSDETQAGVIV